MEVQQERSSPTDTTRRRRLSRAEREQQILGVAEEIFAMRGYQATSMDDVAQRVGLSKPMLYEYFGSKDGLLLACVERAKRELLRVTVEASKAAATPDQLMYDCLLAFFRFSDDHRQAWALLRNEATVPSADSELEAIRTQQTDVTSALLLAMRPDLDQVQLEVFSESIIGACERLALWRERRPEITPDVAVKHIIALIGPSLTPPSA